MICATKPSFRKTSCLFLRSFLWVILAGFFASQANCDDKFGQSTFEINSAIIKIIDSVNVPAELSGVISDLGYREGQMVKTGDELARINSDELELRLKKAEIENRISKSTAESNVDVLFAQKSLEVSSNRVSRSRRSNDKVPGVVPAAKLEEQQLEMHRDQLRIEQAARDQKIATMKTELASTDVQLTKLLLDKSVIRSPIDGMVVAVEAKPGEWLQPGETVIKIVRMDRLKVEGFVPANIASQMRIGDPALAVVNQEWLKNETFPGKVVFINPEANPVNANVQIWIEIENRDMKLIPGLDTTLTISFGR